MAIWVTEAAEQLGQTVEKIAEWVSVSPVQHADETGVRLAGKLHWLHARRGSQTLEAIGIWPRFRGRAMQNR